MIFKHKLLLLYFLCFQSLLAQDDTSDDQGDSSLDTPTSQPSLTSNEKVDPSTVTFKIEAIEPVGGPTTGETRVLVKGGPFSGMNDTYPKPYCKFGHDDMVVEATYVLCTSASQFLDQREARHKDKDQMCLQCDNAPASTKDGVVSFTISMIGDFSDVINSVSYRYYKPTRVWAIYPHYGPKDGETIVQVWGENFINYEDYTRCAFGTKSVKATFINSNYMICESPFSDVVEKAIPFTISLNNQQNSKDDMSYWYYSWPAITELVPDRGPDAGGTKVLLKGRNFYPFNYLGVDNANDTFCKFENLAKVPAKIINSTKAICYSPPSYILRSSVVELTLNNQQYTDDNNIFYYYRPPSVFDLNPREGPLGGGTPVTFIGNNFRDTGNITAKFGDKVVNCTYKSSSEVVCVTPPQDEPGYYPASVSLENDLYSQPQQFLYYEKPTVTVIGPICGPDYGYTQIKVIGKNFLDLGNNKAFCVFNKTIFTNATIMDSTTILCDSPSLINSQGYSMMKDKMLFYLLEITLDGGREINGPPFQFNYYKDPKIYLVDPESGPITGGTKVKVVASGMQQEGVCNRTVRFATFEKKPLQENDTTQYVINSDGEVVPLQNDESTVGTTVNQTEASEKLNQTSKNGTNGTSGEKKPEQEYEKKEIQSPDSISAVVVESPKVKVPDATVVSVSLNGQQYSKDIVIHMKDEENTFEYYQDPYVANFEPLTGPSTGNQKIKVNALGLTPRRNKNGKKDKDRNKLYVRYIDPDTGEQLGDPQQIDPEELSDEDASFKTPKFKPNSKVLMQISLNGQDYTDVPQPGKDYSLNIYESPHITKLHPSFGKVKAKNTQYMLIEGTNFKCPDTNCTELKVRFGEPEENQAIYVRGTLINDTFVKCKIPRYTKPDVLRVELTVNGIAYTSDNKYYGYYDPYILNAEPKLISVDGTTKVKIIGFGFVNSSETQSQFDNPDEHLVCGSTKQSCIKNAEYIDKNTLITETYPQKDMVYQDDGNNIGYDPITINAAVYEGDFTENNVQIWYFQDPQYSAITTYESPANSESDIFITTDFKGNDMEKLKKWSNFTCRFMSADGRVMYTKGTMKRYPIENGKPNSVHCKTPKWTLGDKQSNEKVKLDIAVNGQDFSGGFEFTFAIELKIYRTVPMAGPVQGKSSTRVIGLGYKPPNDYVNIKWGVVRTTRIEKVEVIDYIYYKLQFENMIEGSEEIKAYVYEASSFQRVDLPMIESNTYHSITMKTPMVYNWTRTQGGPYYVEIGRNVSVQYISEHNVSITTGNHTENKTEKVEKSHIFFNYDPSHVEYYYYKDCIVKQLQPHSGLLSGGTQVQVAGAWFKYLPEYGVVPHCKFGDKIVRASFDSTVRIVCPAPPSTQVGQQIPFEVSLNGQDWTKSGLQFTYYEQPQLDYISPDSGPESGGTPIYIFGSNFSNSTSSSEFNCKFTPKTINVPPKYMPAAYMNSSAIMCASPGGWGQGDAMHLQVTFNGGDYDDNNFNFTFFSVIRVYPKSGPSDGTGGDIIVEGQGFKNDSGALCKLNNTVWEPVFITWNQIHCPMVRAQGGDNYFGNVPLSVSPNGKDWTNVLGGFQYYAQPTVEEIYPKQGPAQGLGIINFYGDGFRNDYNNEELACKVGESIGKAVYVSSRQIKCVVEDLELTNEGEYLPAQVALNNYSWTNPNNNSYYLPYGIQNIYPTGGPTTGTTDVLVQGKGFVDLGGDVARCRFGTPSNYAIVQAQILSYDKIACRAPQNFQVQEPAQKPQDIPFAIALTADEYDPWTETSMKFRVYDQPQLISCEPCESDVGTIQEVLVWADESAPYFDPVPLNKPADGETIGPSTVGGIMCQFGRFGATSGLFINETLIKCVTPSIDDDPDSIYRETVTLSIAMNGQDYEEESSQLEYTFIGTGTYLVFWPFIIAALLIGLLILACVVCCATIFQSISLDDMLAGRKGSARDNAQANVFNMGGGVIIPRGRADWNKDRSSVDILEKASGNNFA